MATPEQSIYPVIMGNEEETRCSIYYPDMAHERPLACYEVDTILARSFACCRPLPGSATFRINGGRIYNDGRGGELCTPECSDSDELITYIAANDEIWRRGIKRFLHATVKGARIVQQRRVADAEGNRWACHDNLSLQEPIANQSNPVYESNDINSDEAKLVIAHLITRNFITGAGLVTPEGVLFSQKLSGRTKFNSYGFGSSLFRINKDHGARMEFRCNDINLYEWAVKARTGMEELLVAGLQAGLATKLVEKLPATVAAAVDRSDAQNIATLAHNAVPLDGDLRLVHTEWLDDSLSFTRYLLDTLLEQLPDHEAMPPIYRSIGQALVHYCDNFEAVLNGEPLATLTDRSDWSAKLETVLLNLRRDRTKGIDRELGDAKSQAVDILYDRKLFTTGRNRQVATVLGYGYRLAAQHRITSTAAVNRAICTPPLTTRAARRVKKALTTASVQGYDWHKISYYRPNSTALTYINFKRLVQPQNNAR